MKTDWNPKKPKRVKRREKAIKRRRELGDISRRPNGKPKEDE